MAKRMVGVIKNDVMVLPYGMFLTRLYRHVSTIQPCPLTEKHFLTPHVMVPFIEGRAKMFLVNRKGLIHQLPPPFLHPNLNPKIKKIMIRYMHFRHSNRYTLTLGMHVDSRIPFAAKGGSLIKKDLIDLDPHRFATSATSSNHWPPPASNETSEPPPCGKMSLDSLRHISKSRTHMTRHQVNGSGRLSRVTTGVGPRGILHGSGVNCNT
nr:hypothetical protein [Tanacetum cinerariifolium]